VSARDPFGKNNRFCRGCGCTEHKACCVAIEGGMPVGCSWVALDLDGPSGFCSSCAIEHEWDQTTIAALDLYSPPERYRAAAS
jgi:hypothetical protein